MNSDQNQSKPTDIPFVEKEDEIDLFAIAKTLWENRKILLITTFSGFIIGLFVAILTPKEYTVSTVMVPQVSSGSKSQLSSLASLAGIDIGINQSQDLSPLIYPQIVNSVPFKLELMNTPIHFSKIDHPVSVYEYYTKYYKPTLFEKIQKYTIGLPGILFGSIVKNSDKMTLPKDLKNNKLYYLTKKQYKIKAFLDKSISLQVEKKEGYLTLVVSLSEPLATAELAQKSQELLQLNITNFKIEKSQADLDFIQERFNVAKAEAETYQVNLAVNTDRFKNLTSSLPQVSTNRIQSKYTIANSVFLDLAKQLEQAKIQVKKDTPVFTIIEPVAIPSEKSKPSRPMIIFVWILIGGMVGIGMIYGKRFALGFKQKWNE